MNLLVDIGNTRLKWALQQSGTLEYFGAANHNQDDFSATLISAWQFLPIPDYIYIACVSFTELKQLLTTIIRQLWPHCSIQEIHTEKYSHGISNAYHHPEKLGVDRWLAMLGAVEHYSMPVCIVDFGTAITLDVIDEQRRHLGGMIMPGLTLLKQSLSNNTADLNFCSEVYKQGLAKDTQAAIYNGCLYAVKGFIEAGLMQTISPSRLILTGGDAEFLATTLELDAVVDTQLVFKGMALLSSEQSVP
ncbi:type III pantothenate kinase [methanotrophic endosymbiont of Bathymodiolus puteoserpentis (Logatchev)]|jgi:type III pantothenate kinase|uniref:type III pantothenate kinase n=1 Tax=methanotrophic endosymbiont of Bathymodiolus puteoserpentis (Logatchev) TaxID=343235 RepID=UPI0013CCDA46|nr:type III pantothenate kinase [methanotrophic endosymbiont of Bathymodiolus puteoserpentis (Logatchev)]SHE23452.1 Pantothenate kinase type III, CoaX-like [methanotrophic endosymbiont of Bathymodiolus puteoserpentis (Logatchev)]